MNTALKLAILAGLLMPAACTSPNTANPLTRVSRTQVAVAFGDLDLESDAGRDELRQRIAAAARIACNGENTTAFDTFVAVRCERNAMAPHVEGL